jgi:hypothetical protein
MSSFRPSVPIGRPSGRWLAAGLVTALAVSALFFALQSDPGRVSQLRSGGGVAAPPREREVYGRIAGLISPSADHPALDRLDPALLAAVRSAAEDAAADDIDLKVTSGWRSRDYQQDLFDRAVSEYGSPEEAIKWVQTPDGSAHTTGDAVDVGPTDAAYWLAQYGSDYGLCQVYAHEIWHYELLTEPGGECPAIRTDASS